MATALTIDRKPAARSTRRRTARHEVAEAPAAILDRWMPYAAEKDRCACADCRELRAQAFECDLCGYSGEPLVHPCQCIEEHNNWMRVCARAVRQATRHGRDRTFGDKLAVAKERLREWQSRPTPSRCSVADVGPSCCHGAVECPVCIGRSAARQTWGGDNNQLHAWNIIRDLRTALRLALQG